MSSKIRCIYKNLKKDVYIYDNFNTFKKNVAKAFNIDKTLIDSLQVFALINKSEKIIINEEMYLNLICYESELNTLYCEIINESKFIDNDKPKKNENLYENIEKINKEFNDLKNRVNEIYAILMEKIEQDKKYVTQNEIKLNNFEMEFKEIKEIKLMFNNIFPFNKDKNIKTKNGNNDIERDQGTVFKKVQEKNKNQLINKEDPKSINQKNKETILNNKLIFKNNNVKENNKTTIKFTNNRENSLKNSYKENLRNSKNQNRENLRNSKNKETQKKNQNININYINYNIRENNEIIKNINKIEPKKNNYLNNVNLRENNNKLSEKFFNEAPNNLNNLKKNNKNQKNISYKNENIITPNGKKGFMCELYYEQNINVQYSSLNHKNIPMKVNLRLKNNGNNIIPKNTEIISSKNENNCQLYIQDTLINNGNSINIGQTIDVTLYIFFKQPNNIKPGIYNLKFLVRNSHFGIIGKENEMKVNVRNDVINHENFIENKNQPRDGNEFFLLKKSI